MKTIVVRSSNVISNADMYMTHGLDVFTSTGKGILLETLKKRMMAGEVCRFAYKKINGSIRIAVGCLQEQAVNANIKGTGMPKRYYGMFSYLDLEKMAWRSFKENNFIGIID